jgi:small subunit ribosomal protein S4e
MARKGGSTRLKRQAAPSFYAVPRKKHPFLTTIEPGPHPASVSYDPITLLRDVIKVVRTKKEAEYAIKLGRLMVDGLPRRSIRFPIGLMDVVELGGTDKAYRMLPEKGHLVSPFVIPYDERNRKLCQVRSKVTVKRGRIQLGTHDGRTFLVEEGPKYSLGDALLVELPSGRILDVVSMKKGNLGLVVKGTKLGFIGEIKEVMKGSFSVEPSVRVSLGSDEVVLPKDFVIPVGAKAPLLTLPRRVE